MPVAQDPAELTIAATKPGGKPAKMLAEIGIAIVRVEEDEGNVDRYLLSPRLAVERRTGGGLLKGIMDKTLFTSAVYLREHFELPVLMIEGDVNYEYTGFDPRAVRGAMSSMVLEYGISVFATPHVDETVAQLAMMARQEQVGIPEISMIPKRKATDLADLQRRVVEMLPGCGMTMARQLLQRFGSVQEVLRAEEAEFLECPGIGQKKAAEISRVLHTVYRSVDTEKDLEDAIEADPSLLSDAPLQLLDRQHYIFSDGEDRHFIDLVFMDVEAGELLLVELKRGRLSRMHQAQLRRYLDNAGQSKVLGPLIDAGMLVRGVLATVEECEFESTDRDIGSCIVDRERAMDVLVSLREHRHAEDQRGAGCNGRNHGGREATS